MTSSSWHSFIGCVRYPSMGDEPTITFMRSKTMRLNGFSPIFSNIIHAGITTGHLNQKLNLERYFTEKLSIKLCLMAYFRFQLCRRWLRWSIPPMAHAWKKKTVFCSSSPLKTHCVNLTRFDPSESSKRVSIHESSKFSKLLHFKTISWMNEIIIEVNR